MTTKAPNPHIGVTMTTTQPTAAPITGQRELADLMQSGALVPVIHRVFTLGDAVRYVETDHARGKVVIVVDHAALDPLKPPDRQDPPPQERPVKSSADTDLTPSVGANHTHLTED